MTKLSRVSALATSLLLAGSIAACGGGDGGGASSTGSAATSSAETSGAPTEAPNATATSDDTAAGQTVTVMTAETDLGTILVDGAGMTLYLFTNDTPGVSTCEGGCLAAWPPLLGTPRAGDGVDDSLLGTLQRSDGSTQVSYNGWPLYYWASDAVAGDTTGQGVNNVWWVVNRDGEAVGAGQ